ncbi:MAG: hypothetical protein MUD12_04865 [Spirochaetes bacterium]|jgi:Na+/serine symporter|nr:hypothetical protein [Spirochaetota bacterium]
MKISVKLIKQEDQIIANCPELEINCYGSSEGEAIRRIKSVINFYVESAKDLGLDVDTFNEITIEGGATVNMRGASLITANGTIN